jgi:hypothetical protein
MKHIVLGYPTTDEGEVRLQAFMFGNGHMSFPVFITIVFGILAMPEHWKATVRAYHRGKRSARIANWNWNVLVCQPNAMLRSKISNNKTTTMKQSSLFVSFITVGAFLFTVLFWQERLAVNAIIFSSFIAFSILILYPDAKKRTAARFLFAVHFICLALLVWQNTGLTTIAYGSSLLLLVGFSEYTHRSIWFAGVSAVWNFVLFIIRFPKLIYTVFKDRKGISVATKKRLSLLIFPVMVFIIFFLIYSVANGVLSNWMEQLAKQIDTALKNLLALTQPERLLFLLLGFFISEALLLRSHEQLLEAKEAILNDNLLRKSTRNYKRVKTWWHNTVLTVMGKNGEWESCIKKRICHGIDKSFIVERLADSS